MNPGMHKFILSSIFFLGFLTLSINAEEKIQSVPLLNLEELSPTFEEDKDELENTDEDTSAINDNNSILNQTIEIKKNKIYINLTALDKITAKTSFIKLAVGEKKIFGPLEIKALKCQLTEDSHFLDTVAYIQVKDLSIKDNDQVFLFNGWTFASSPTLKSIDHPVYDLWITSCENV